MRDLDDALEALSVFESLVEHGLHPSKSLEKVEHENEWDSFNFARLEFRVGQLTVGAYAHACYGRRFLDVSVWDFSAPSDNALKFQMSSDAEHVARVVADYLNEYEVAA